MLKSGFAAAEKCSGVDYSNLNSELEVLCARYWHYFAVHTLRARFYYVTNDSRILFFTHSEEVAAFMYQVQRLNASSYQPN